MRDRSAKSFSAAARARITLAAVERIREDGSIGAVERIAGIEGEESRRRFWAPFTPICEVHGTQAYIDAAMAECRRIIAVDRTEWVAL